MPVFRTTIRLTLVIGKRAAGTVGKSTGEEIIRRRLGMWLRIGKAFHGRRRDLAMDRRGVE
jgi:hypothetical protein